MKPAKVALSKACDPRMVQISKYKREIRHANIERKTNGRKLSQKARDFLKIGNHTTKYKTIALQMTPQDRCNKIHNCQIVVRNVFGCHKKISKR